jgi:acyl transferase domain-containing protein
MKHHIRNRCIFHTVCTCLLWRSWGIEPAAVAGHSVGEYAAACIAGIVTLEDAATLIVHRGRLIQSLPKDGLMAAVFEDLPLVEEILVPYVGDVAIAAENSPQNLVISGRTDTVRSVLDQLAAKGVKSKPLNVSHAFHSPLMDPVIDEFYEIAKKIQFHPPVIPMVSALTGELIKEGEIIDASYWRRHIRERVRFAAAIAGWQNSNAVFSSRSDPGLPC